MSYNHSKVVIALVIKSHMFLISQKKNNFSFFFQQIYAMLLTTLSYKPAYSFFK